ncbi:MAG: HNH endonuclease, partial [Acidobacteria bacterium]|nr:HNH endonuclease [Acidobacteriota bacterium]
MEIIKLESNGKAERVRFNGHIYRRYPESGNLSDQRYYKRSGRQAVYALHREVWKYFHGDIPPGFHVHHRDHNPDNNDISNLECVHGAEHISTHTTQPNSWPNSIAGRANLDKIRHLTKEWHASPEGHKWHVDHGKRCAERRESVEFKCEHCGDMYRSKNR